MSRRTFLLASAAASCLPALGRAHSANAELRVAVMGVNGRGRDLARGFAAQAGVRLAYLCDVDEQALSRALVESNDVPGGVPQGERDFRRVLDDPQVDVLVVATPDHWHAPATILGCAAGKHVYVEKPACHNGQEGEWMLAAAERHGRIVQLGTQRRSSPGHVEAVTRLHAGAIGKVLFARGWITSTRPTIGRGTVEMPPPHLDYDLWQGPAPRRPYPSNLVHYHWHWFWHWGTGELGNNGIHALDICRWGLGVDYPTRIVCGGGKYHFQDDQETPDTQLATFHFDPPAGEEGAGKSIHWEHRTWNRQGLDGETFGIVFYGEAGTMSITGGKCHQVDADGKLIEEWPAGYTDADHIGNFLSAIRQGDRLNAPLQEGVTSTALCHLGNIAYRTGRTIHFDPTTRSIPNDAEAAALWRRDYEPGWEPKV